MCKFAASLFLALVVVASPAQGQKVTLNVSYSSGAYAAMLEETARSFEAHHPSIKIAYRAPVVATYDELIQQTLRAQITGDLPDVSFQGNQNVKFLAQRGLPVQLDSLITREANWDKLGYASSVKAVGEVDGKIYALSYATSVPIIYFNIDLVRRAGADPQNLPQTWPEIAALARKIHGLGGGVIGGFFDYQSTGNWTFQALITSQGGRMMTPDDTKIIFDGKEGVEALRILQMLGATGAVDMTQAQALQAFGAGAVGVLASFSAAIEQLEKQAAGKFEMRTGQWPMLSAEGKVPAGGRAAMIFARDPERQRAAWEFVKFVTGPIGQTILVKGVGAVPNNHIAIREPDLLGRFYEAHPNHKAAFALVPVLTSWYSFPGENSVKIANVLRDHLRTVYIRQRDPAAAMPEMVRDVKALLPRG
jgi:multiple sugar transport system substrate-binding protein